MAHIIITEVQLAEQLNLSPLTLKDWRMQGRGPKWFKFPGTKPGTGYAVRYKQQDVDAWLAAITAESVQRAADHPSPRARRVSHAKTPDDKRKRRLRAA